MAKDAANDISYYLLIDDIYRSDLANIRQWNNLKIGFDENRIWVKDFDYVQINSLEVKSIPYKSIFYAKESKLFLLNSHLPDRTIPALLWTSIDRALPIKLPSFNHNYFGIQEKLSVRLISTDVEVEIVAMITTFELLRQYIETAPTIRLQRIKWVILNNNKVLLVGKPLLPIKGRVFWQKSDFLIPAGFDFDLFLLSNALNNLLNPEKDCWVVWETDNTCFAVNKSDMQPLSLSSFRLSIQPFLND